MATPQTVQDKSKVSLDYEGRLDDGTVFDSSTHGDHSHPLEFVVGAGNVIPGFEKAVMGMKVDETKTFSIPPAEAYGDKRGELTHVIPKAQLPPHPEGKELEVGMQLGMKTPDGHTIPVAITKVDKDSITLDMNHPLAGKTLTFTIKVIKIE